MIIRGYNIIYHIAMIHSYDNQHFSLLGMKAHWKRLIILRALWRFGEYDLMWMSLHNKRNWKQWQSVLARKWFMNKIISNVSDVSYKYFWDFKNFKNEWHLWGNNNNLCDEAILCHCGLYHLKSVFQTNQETKKIDFTINWYIQTCVCSHVQP